MDRRKRFVTTKATKAIKALVVSLMFVDENNSVCVWARAYVCAAHVLCPSKPFSSYEWRLIYMTVQID